ncbi:MAG TPA: hypothetical protein VF246_00590 [Acidimicrobiia bacterium]
MRRARLLGASLVAVLALIACTGDPETTTTTSVAGDGTLPGGTNGATTTTSSVPEASNTTLRGQPVTDYETVARLPTTNGEVLHIVIPQGGYTDVDLFGFIADLKEADPDLWGVEVFDDAAAAEAFAVAEAERTEEQSRLIDQHHLISLVSGDTVVYQGPFEEFGQQILGS